MGLLPQAKAFIAMTLLKKERQLLILCVPIAIGT